MAGIRRLDRIHGERPDGVRHAVVPRAIENRFRMSGACRGACGHEVPFVPGMIPKKPAPDLIGGGHRFSDKIMLRKA
jgi:hypothetical protein